MIGAAVTVLVDRPLGSAHPAFPDLIYPVNYGYIPGVMAQDGEDQDAYILGVDRPVKRFAGRVVAVIRRRDDVEDKWVVAPEDRHFTREEIAEAVRFRNDYFRPKSKGSWDEAAQACAGDRLFALAQSIPC